MDYDDWPEMREYFLGLGWSEHDINILKASRDGVPLYTEQKSALAMVQRLDAAVERYGIAWALVPDCKMLITAGLTERALASFELGKRADEVVNRYRREIIYPRYAQEKYSERQSKAGSKPREERAANSRKAEIEYAVKEELLKWTRNSASKLANRFGVTRQYIGKIKAKL